MKTTLSANEITKEDLTGIFFEIVNKCGQDDTVKIYSRFLELSSNKTLPISFDIGGIEYNFSRDKNNRLCLNQSVQKFTSREFEIIRACLIGSGEYDSADIQFVLSDVTKIEKGQNEINREEMRKIATIVWYKTNEVEKFKQEGHIAGTKLLWLNSRFNKVAEISEWSKKITREREEKGKRVLKGMADYINKKYGTEHKEVAA